jgi:large subunit GTPase 1
MVDIHVDEHSKNIKSTLETNNLDEFLSLTKLSQKKFEVLNEIMVMQNINGENRDVSQNEFSNVLMRNILKNSEINLQDSKSLAIPKRPQWKEGISAKEFERMEREAFLNWRRLLAEEEEKNLELAITPFEKNIEIWRQLWLVVEKSQVLIQIVDGRNPLFFRSLDLEKYIKDVSQEKEIILLVNKADLLTPEIRRHWANYFNENKIKYIFFSALVEAEKIEIAEEEEKKRQQSNNIKDIIEKTNVNITDKNKKIEIDEDSDYDENEYDRLKNQFMKLRVDKDEETPEEEKQITHTKKKEIEIKTVVTKEIKEEVRIKNTKEKEQIEPEKIQEEKKINDEIKIDEVKLDENKEEKKTLQTMSIKELEDLHKKNLEIKVLNRDEFLLFMKEITKTKKKNVNTEHYYIGFIGYPNVGKSSVINVLMKKKRVNIISFYLCLNVFLISIFNLNEIRLELL